MLFLLLACATGSDAVPTDYSSRGPHAVGHQALQLAEPERPLTVEVWYPAESEGGGAVPEAFLSGEFSETYAALLADTPQGCATQATTAGLEAPPLDGEWPLLVFSHCHNCVRFSAFTIAEHLASHGFVVAAPDHLGNTLVERLADEDLPLDTDTLALRVADQGRVVDALLELGLGPDGVQLSGQLGAFGHSFGSVTTGLFTQHDGRPEAALGLAAPMENPLLPGVEIASIGVPTAFLVAVEDNSITELGNELIRTNWEEAPGPSWKLELEDAGHWSVSDVAGLIEDFDAGCGDGERQTDGEAFSYLPSTEGLAIAREFTAAFFAETLRGEVGATARADGVEAP